ncbi:hypothetical protein J2X88_000805 [Pseudomonas extremaustralis]|nr:hypothetical protein [Pseudomonas extremaustralis]
MRAVDRDFDTVSYDEPRNRNRNTVETLSYKC